MFNSEIKQSSVQIKDEYYSFKNGAGIHLVDNSVIVQLSGKDTLDFLHRVSTNSIKELKPYEKKNTLFLNEKGRFIDRTTLLNLESFYILIGSPDENKKLLNWVSKYIIMEDIQTKDVTNDYQLIELIGPQSESYLTLLVGDESKNIANDSVIYTRADGFQIYLFRNPSFNGKNAINILIEKEKKTDFIQYMLENKSVFDVSLISDTTYNIARVECGLATSPNEINDNYNPYETNLINEVCSTKGCYIGQEIIARLDTYGKIQKKMMGFILPENPGLEENIFLFDDNGNEAGEITSIVNSEMLKKKIGVGFLRNKILSENKIVYTEYMGNRIPITFCDLPFKK